jgi:hypothetical protein
MINDFGEYAVKVSIESKVGEVEHKTNFELKEATELERVIMIQNIFKVMGVENDISSMIEDYSKIGKAYNSFFSKVDPIEAPSTEMTALKSTDAEEGSLASKLSEKLQEQNVNAEAVSYSKYKLAEEYDKAMNDVVDSRPEHYRTGIKEENNVKKYQCRSVCTCGNQQTNYIIPTQAHINCKSCGKRHKTRWAKQGYLEKDSRNNFFIAGKFVGEEEMK